MSSLPPCRRGKAARTVPLLAGTALVTVLSTTAGAQEAYQLDAINIDGASYETEGSDSYTSDLVSVGEKAAMSTRDVPQSTTVVTRKQIEDGGYTALEDALADTPGIMVLNNDRGRSSLFSRGYEFDYLFFDGLPAPVSSIYGTQPDLSIVDHVEILKGPNGLFIGTGEPAGSINMRLKQATETEPTGYVAGSWSSVGRGRIEADAQGKLNESGTLRGRIVGAYEDGDSFVDGASNGVKSIYGTLAWDVSPNTTLTFGLAHMERDISPFNGLPTNASGELLWLDVGTTTGAYWNDFENATTDAVIAAEHLMANGGRLKFSLRSSRQEADFLYAYAGSAADADNVVNGLAYLGRQFEQTALAADAHAELPFTLGTVQGNLIVGADIQRVKADTLTDRGRIAGSFDLDDWDTSGTTAPTLDYAEGNTTDELLSRGLYTQVRVNPVDRLTLIGGARISWYDLDATNNLTATTETLDEDGKITPYAGVTYDLRDNVTLYASYTEIFQPQTLRDASDAILAPREATQYEAGVKAEVGAGLNLSFALFHMEEENSPIRVTSTSYEAADVRVRGAEFEASGEVLPNLHLAAGYTYTDTVYLSGSSSGEPFSTYTPEHMAKLQVMYDFEGGRLDGWSVGGRVTAMSGFSSNGIEAGGYAVVDAMVAKDLGHDARLQVSVNNLFDRDYYTRVGSTTVFNFRGAPRTVNVSLTKRF
ncbi:TonB-dependent siderophore receptor [Pseudooceanicola sp. LIPI14-2-Ac024]|uniref:TonB-dependent siderophore receptor n=1 Tax=Pseudooceanicola sp. LIPI14-2-Ac024 TaxID=3344875 RepID=UPI0035D05BB2